MSKILPVSCLGSCYYKTSSFELEHSIRSLFSGEFVPSQVVLVLDGPLPRQTIETIDALSAALPGLTPLALETNQGLGLALSHGLTICEHDIVLRFDTDDLSLPGRLSAQYSFFLANPDISCCGSDVLEVFPSESGIKARLKRVPRNGCRVGSLLRNPLNHPSVAFRKKHILACGGYRHCSYFEDYYLWIRLIVNGFAIRNLEGRVLVVMDRPALALRRSGAQYFVSEISFAFKLLLDGSGYFTHAVVAGLRACLRLAFGSLVTSTPWRSSWRLLHTFVPALVSRSDYSLIVDRFASCACPSDVACD